MKMTKEKFKKAIREEIIEMLSGGDDSMTDQIYALISRANMSDDAKEVMMKWMEHTDNPQAIIDYLEGTMNEATIEVKPEDLDKVKSKANPEDTIRIVKEIDEDEIDKKAIKNASSGKKIQSYQWPISLLK
jgi:Asp-tRNA(Asn)/Glu-tRNA(Gln) amidotransferase B subunit